MRDYKNLDENRFKTQDWGFKQLVLGHMKSVEQQMSYIGLNGFKTDEIRGTYLSVRSLAKLLFPYVTLDLKDEIREGISELDSVVNSISNYQSEKMSDITDKRNFAFRVGDLLGVCYRCLPYIGIRMTEMDYGDIDDNE